MWGVAGALSVQEHVGVGAGLDVAVLTKAVKAYTNGKVISKEISVQALAREQLISVSASIGVGGTVEWRFRRHLNIESRHIRVVGFRSRTLGTGFCLVSAYDSTNAVLTAGSIPALDCRRRCIIEVSVTNKDFKAYIDQKQLVYAEETVTVCGFSGSYSKTYVEENTLRKSITMCKIDRQTFDYPP
jgi:hypothetical protein